MMRHSLLALLCAAAPPARALPPQLAHIQRGMAALEASTAEQPARLRVMFYGQSIVAQNWTDHVRAALTNRYPTAEIEFHKAAIGGYESPRLIQTAEHDLYPWYPDLLFFHVYGPLDKYERIIERTRERTTAEIVLWTSHLGAGEDPAALAEKLDERSTGILAIADKYRCHKIDLRRKWCRHLLDNNLAPTNLLTDSIHLNKAGCELYGKLIAEEILRAPALGENAESSGTITLVDQNSPAVERGPGGRLTLRFEGNRVVAISDGRGAPGARATLLLDGQPLDPMRELWAFSRPSVAPGVWWPAVNHIACEATPVAEEWTLTFLPESSADGRQVHFTLCGSVTGADGEGCSTTPFVSRSRRVVIQPDVWNVVFALSYRKATLPQDYKVTWRSYPLFATGYKPGAAGTRTLLVQGCGKGPHTLTIVPEGGSPGIGAFSVHRPVGLNP